MGNSQIFDSEDLILSFVILVGVMFINKKLSMNIALPEGMFIDSSSYISSPSLLIWTLHFLALGISTRSFWLILQKKNLSKANTSE